MKPNDLIGKKYKFYGAVNNRFRLNNKVYECVEDPSDDYRSRMEDFKVELINKSNKNSFGLFTKPVALVELKREKDYDTWDNITPDPYSYEGLWYLIDEFNHIWLTFGTNCSDDYYPSFTFNYEPKSYEHARRDYLTAKLAKL